MILSPHTHLSGKQRKFSCSNVQGYVSNMFSPCMSVLAGSMRFLLHLLKGHRLGVGSGTSLTCRIARPIRKFPYKSSARRLLCGRRATQINGLNVRSLLMIAVIRVRTDVLLGKVAACMVDLVLRICTFCCSAASYPAGIES